MDGLTIDVTGIGIADAVVRALRADEATMTEIHNKFAQYMDPYVPMQSGTLAQSPRIDANGVHYNQPYAHYQYEGLVYGPNIPIIRDGVVVGFFSRPGEPKHPTGAHLEYSKEMHPLATDHWDKAMMRDRGDEFIQSVKEILTRRANSGEYN